MSTGASAKETNSILVVSHVIIVLFSPMAVVGNAVVLMAIWKNSFQRTSFHILLSVLAFTDLCTGMATPLMSIPYLLLHTFGTVSAIGIFIEAYLVSLTILVITLMSIERWVHMTHRSLLTSRRGYITAVISLLVPIPLVTLQVFNYIEERLVPATNAISGVYMLSCYFATSVAYFKVFRIIRQSVRNQSRQNFGRPAIDLAKYKKSIFSILYILALFSLCILPFIVRSSSLFFWVRRAERGHYITYLWFSYFQHPVSILVFIFGEWKTFVMESKSCVVAQTDATRCNYYRRAELLLNTMLKLGSSKSHENHLLKVVAYPRTYPLSGRQFVACNF